MAGVPAGSGVVGVGVVRGVPLAMCGLPIPCRLGPFASAQWPDGFPDGVKGAQRGRGPLRGGRPLTLAGCLAT